ncbi:MAG: type IV pilus biogenesis/stability protein PilW [Burkholderiales bacterium]|jgi:type IV pilus assembly protein PilF|nr:type IV pilus biogenesis/stability protein PilW [Burkholderiales bacterium]
MMRYLRFLMALMLSLALAACVTTPRNSQSVPASRESAVAHTNLAMGYYELGQLGTAIDELNLAKEADATYPNIYNGFGLVYSYTDENEKARANFERALQLDPTNSEFRFNWGWFLCTSGRAAASLPEFDRVIADPLYKTPEIALTNAGRCAYVSGNIEAAKTYLNRALVVKPGYPEASFTLADIAYRQGAYQEARARMRPVAQSATPAVDHLFLGVCIERRLNDKSSEQAYISRLRSLYPNSEQTKLAIRREGCK